MKDWKRTIISPSAIVREALHVIDQGAMQVALVVDSSDKLLGVVTDGDVRRALLRGLTLETQVSLILNKDPIVVKAETPRDTVRSIMKKWNIHQLPILDSENRLIGLHTRENLDERIRPETVVIMAGGSGKRLLPLTENCPKPMLKIGKRPLLETSILHLRKFGFRKFVLSVNYRSHQIKEYFGSGEKLNVSISYIEEEKPLGTAGALGLIPKTSKTPIVVMNGDILTNLNFDHLLHYHKTTASEVTMCVRDYEIQIPYGIALEEEDGSVLLDEKPLKRFLINAGIYVLNPKVLSLIPENTYMDMNSLVERGQKDALKTKIFPIREYWLDIGHHSDFDRANREYPELFGAHFDELEI